MPTETRSIETSDIRKRRLSADVALPRERTEDVARRLSLLAMRNWEKALTGFLMVPAAAATTTGAAALFAMSILERTFGLFEVSVADVGRRVGEDFDVLGDVSSRSVESSDDRRRRCFRVPGGVGCSSSAEGLGVGR